MDRETIERIARELCWQGTWELEDDEREWRPGGYFSGGNWRFYYYHIGRGQQSAVFLIGDSEKYVRGTIRALVEDPSIVHFHASDR